MEKGAQPGAGNESPAQTVQIEITWGSIFRVLLGILLAGIAITLWPMFELIILAVLIAVALYPIVLWTQRRGWPRWTGLMISAVLLLATSIGFFAFLGPTLLRQTAAAIENLPQLKE